MRQKTLMGQKWFVNQLTEDLIDVRDETRQNVQMDIQLSQEQHRRNCDRKCKQSHQYIVGDSGAFERTQIDVGLKLKDEFRGPNKKKGVILIN